jgi:hypothetical protein
MTVHTPAEAYHVAFVGELLPELAARAVLECEVQAIVVLKRGVEGHHPGVRQLLQSPLFHVDFVVHVGVLWAKETTQE